MSKIDLSIIIPAFQESRRIEKSLDELAAFLKTRNYGDVEVIASVAEGNDNTRELAAAKAPLFENFKVVNPGPRVGKGRDVRYGMLEATGRYRVFMDADLATPLTHLDDVKSWMDREGDVAIAVRQLNQTHKGFRKYVSEIGNILVRLILLPGIPDSQCGFKAFSAKAAEAIFSRQTILGWGFDMEILAIAKQLGYKIELIPAPDWVDVPEGTIHGQIGSAALTTLKDLLLIAWRRLIGRYKSPNYNHAS